ncbi:MAG: hypothetical protein QM736_04935 [Vicinamibacterales bacterium]
MPATSVVPDTRYTAYIPGLLTVTNATVLFAPASGSFTHASAAVTGLSCAEAAPTANSVSTAAASTLFRIRITAFLISTPVWFSRHRTSGAPNTLSRPRLTRKPPAACPIA